MYNSRQIGILGENIACNYLLKNNYIILERNFYCRQGEIDIIAKDLSTNDLVFVEVKSRFSLKYGFPSEAVNKNKKHHIYSVAKYYIYKNKIVNVPIRFDIIEVFMKNNGRINHIKQVI